MAALSVCRIPRLRGGWRGFLVRRECRRRRPFSTLEAEIFSGDFRDVGFNEESATILHALQGKKPRLPSVVYLYDDKGSSLFEDITRLDEYYITRCESKLLRTHAEEMAYFPDEDKAAPRAFDSAIIELGAGAGKKITPILLASDAVRMESECKTLYIPVDYSGAALDENLREYNVPENFSRLQIHPITGTNEKALENLTSYRKDISCLKGEERITVAFLGSSIGNEKDAGSFLKGIMDNFGPRDRMLLTVDLAAYEPNKPRRVIELAYNDKNGITEKFILNSLSFINSIVGRDLNFDEGNFRLFIDYTESNILEIYAECTRDCEIRVSSGGNSAGTLLVNTLKAGDKIFIEQSAKFSDDALNRILGESRLICTRSWEDPRGYVRTLELVKDTIADATRATEFVFEDLVGAEKLHTRPIDLRNPFGFYWGHLSAFADLKALGLPDKEFWTTNFERGIDPDVNQPHIVHDHSKLLDSWPTASEYKEYGIEVERGMRNLVRHRGVTREVLFSLEHFDMHLETLLYMGSECGWAVDQNNYSHPLSAFADVRELYGCQRSAANEVVKIPSCDIVLGMSKKSYAFRGFAWDNELPAQRVTVDEFAVSTHPVSNAEYLEFVRSGGYAKRAFWDDRAWEWITAQDKQAPNLWERNGETFAVRTLLDGSLSWEDCCDWPVIVTLCEAQAFCSWVGGGARIMTEAEYHALFENDADFYQAALAGNNNFKFRTYSPVGIMSDSTGKGVMDTVGNGWEHTCTPFYGFDGFTPMHDYHNYSTDFFDGKHFVVKGAGPFTMPSVVRPSFRNWYQQNYQYASTKFRVAYD